MLTILGQSPRMSGDFSLAEDMPDKTDKILHPVYLSCPYLQIHAIFDISLAATDVIPASALDNDPMYIIAVCKIEV